MHRLPEIRRRISARGDWLQGTIRRESRHSYQVQEVRMMRIPAAALPGFLVAVGINTVIHMNILQAASPRAVTDDMAGAWVGDAQIFVNWTTQRTLSVALTIAPDARVTGTIGDATLRNGRFESNRNALERAVHAKTDWIVKGDLDADVIKAEGIRRGSVMVPLDWIDGHFEGGVNTSGSHFGGKTSMWLAAGRLKLTRPANSTTSQRPASK
jgi:hypothetical protein